MSESVYRRSPDGLTYMGLRYSRAEIKAAWSENASAALRWKRSEIVEIPFDEEEAGLSIAALWMRRCGGTIEQMTAMNGVLYLRVVGPQDDTRHLMGGVANRTGPNNIVEMQHMLGCYERHGADEGGPLFAPPDGNYDVDLVALVRLLREWAATCGKSEAAIQAELGPRTEQLLEREYMGRRRT